jgi:hypothetical protein
MAHIKRPMRQRWTALALSIIGLGMMTCAGNPGAQGSHISGPAVYQDNPTSPPIPSPEHLVALITLNRDAAAQVALVGLVPVEDRFAAARNAASWMASLLTSLPPAEPYTPRQRVILQAWQGALSDYANTRSGSLSRIRSTSYANATLFAEMVRQLLAGSTGLTSP